MIEAVDHGRSRTRGLAAWARCVLRGARHLAPAAALWQRAPEHSARQSVLWAERSLADFGIHVDVQLDEASRCLRPGALYVHLNQRSLIEALVYPVAFAGIRWVINFEFALSPFGWWPWAAGGVVIHRENPAQAKRALARVRRELQRGAAFGISIEGARSPSGELLRYKKGPAVLAIEAQADIVPFAIRGARRSLGFGEWHPRPGTICVQTFPVISTRGLAYRDRDEIVHSLRSLAERADLNGE